MLYVCQVWLQLKDFYLENCNQSYGTFTIIPLIIPPCKTSFEVKFYQYILD